jgi:tripartite ATP-independent transporter DctM subunit
METSAVDMLILASVLLVALLALKVPIAFTLMAVGFLGILVLEGIGSALSSLVTVPYSTVSSYLLVVIPMFVLMGHFALQSGLSEKAYDAAHKWLSPFKGGLALASTVACALFAATSGSSIATAATVGQIAIPEMKKHNYDSTLYTGAVAAGGTLGILIPPSVALVVYGCVTNESISKLLLAGVIPGIISAVGYMIVVSIWTTVNPKVAPSSPAAISWRERLRSIPSQL